MVKSIFVGLKHNKEELEKLLDTGVNHIIVPKKPIDNEYWSLLKTLDIDLSISLSAFENGICPINPKAKEILFRNMEDCIEFAPKQIWLDHFRFDGHWENARNGRIESIHKKCTYCKGINRTDFLQKLAQDLMQKFSNKTDIGYFAVPLKEDEFPTFFELGQNHKVLGKIFDLSSPMLYHRMLEKPGSYISEYVRYFYAQTQKPVLPIIQIKDMPDNLPDNLTHEEIKKAFHEAAKSPSVGVSIFLWEHMVEKNKVEIIRELFSKN